MWSTLYFLGPDKAYHVPVERQSRPYTVGMARRALELMMQGPLGGTLLRSMPAGMGVDLELLDIVGSTLLVYLDQSFESLGAGRQEALAVVWAMTEFSTVSRVQFYVNGQAYGLPGSGNTAPVERPAFINFEDPYNIGSQNASNLMLYFATPDGSYLFPVVRRVARTEGVARETIEEMIKGPAGGYQAITLMPAGTEINDIRRDGNAIVVDFNSAFLNASNRTQTVNALVLAMTDLTADQNFGVTSVVISVDGVDLGSYWGGAYSGNLYRPRVNPESP
jgi:germination protein M